MTLFGVDSEKLFFDFIEFFSNKFLKSSKILPLKSFWSPAGISSLKSSKKKF